MYQPPCSPVWLLTLIWKLSPSDSFFLPLNLPGELWLAPPWPISFSLLPLSETARHTCHRNPPLNLFFARCSGDSVLECQDESGCQKGSRISGTLYSIQTRAWTIVLLLQKLLSHWPCWSYSPIETLPSSATDIWKYNRLPPCNQCQCLARGLILSVIWPLLLNVTLPLEMHIELH